jgi:glycogen debranching enzyme
LGDLTNYVIICYHLKMTIAKLRLKAASLMKTNRRISKGNQYTLPSPLSYPYQWFWDSCFHALIYLQLDNIDNAKKELLSLNVKQFENGMYPHMIYWKKKSAADFPIIEWGKPDTSNITQPPIIAYSVKRIYDRDLDSSFLRKMYEPLKKYYEYLLRDRDARGLHLVSVINPDESGEDNSSRFDIPLGLPPVHTIDTNFARRLELIGRNIACNFDEKQCMRNFFWVKDVPFNAILVENLQCMSEIAQTLGKDSDSKYFENQKKLVSKAMRNIMLEDGIFWPVYDLEHKRMKVKTWAIFAPLFAGLYTKKEAGALIDNYLLNEKEFNTRYMVPTVPVNDVSYDPNGFWRGPVWLSTNWFIYKGLMRYGKTKEAGKIRQSSLELLEKSGFREQFHPETGEGQGAQDFTWGGLILDMNDTD